MSSIIAIPREYLIIEGGYCDTADPSGGEFFAIVLHLNDGSEAIIWTGEFRQDALREAEEIALRDRIPVFDRTGRPQ
ncbi:hypothetical protein M2323_001978 [Rhodoblastus acidophilus]|uniref:hypothetical protein n=1 Tax=Rhodoblastus acidophilus TaxID=1074 RepID=UPI0022246EF1|nr:hypothetical protein [Rhodoblastus acidophilus]MCW2285684.1 hypothetical protein [Rhodoblastus acidophilus]MCW2333056.1 hypothetical protein [Rhodoblastus acidophilus]